MNSLLGRKRLVLFGSALALAVLGTAALAATKQCSPGVECWGTNGHDDIRGTDSPDEIYGWDGSDRIKGLDAGDRLYSGKGNDQVEGGKGRDKLFGGDENGVDRLSGGRGSDRLFGGEDLDYLWGDRGNDVSYGGADGDYFIFLSNWGHDRIVETPTYRNAAVFRDVFRDLYINVETRQNGHEAKTFDKAWTVNWANSAIRTIVGGRGDDRIWGDGHRNVLDGRHGGNDLILGRGGDDTIYVYDIGGQSSSDTVDCGPGNQDKVFYDQGSDSIDNCEILRPDQT